MIYLAERWVACQREFAVDKIDGTSQTVQFRRPSFFESDNCPNCNATSDYTCDDLVLRSETSFLSQVITNAHRAKVKCKNCINRHALVINHVAAIRRNCGSWYFESVTV
jgi:transcription elongation factor Elf1